MLWDAAAVERYYPLVGRAQLMTDGQGTSWLLRQDGTPRASSVVSDAPPDPLKQAEASLKALKEAKDQDGKRRATEALEKALQKLKQQAKPQGKPGAGPDKEQEP